jgi:hypothetical protein
MLVHAGEYREGIARRCSGALPAQTRIEFADTLAVGRRPGAP